MGAEAVRVRATRSDPQFGWAVKLGARYLVFADSLFETPAYSPTSWHGEYPSVFRVDLSPNDSARFVRNIDGLLLEHIGREYILAGGTPIGRDFIDSTATRLVEERLLDMRRNHDESAARATTSRPLDKSRREASGGPQSACITESTFLRLVSEWREEAARKSPPAH